MACTESTLNLIQDLAKCIFNDRHKSRPTTSAASSLHFDQKQWRHARRLAYEILIFRRPDLSSTFADPLDELGFVLYSTRLADPERGDRLAKSIGQMLPKAVEGDHREIGEAELNVLSFLMSMQHPVPPREATKVTGMLRSPLGNQTNFYTNSLRRIESNRIGVGFNPMQLIKGGFRVNPYIQEIPRCSILVFPPEHSEKRLNPYLSRSQNSDRSLPRLAIREALPELAPLAQPKANSEPPKVYVNCPSWDHLNIPIVLNSKIPQKAFATESPSAFLHILRMQHGDQFNPLMLTTEQLVNDVRLLLAGISTETFCFDPDTISFSLLPNVALVNCTPETTRAAVQQFVECGSCCARLRMMCERNGDLSYKFEGFIFKTLCGAVEEFLQVFVQLVDLFAEGTTLLELANRLATVMRQVGQLAQMLAIHPNGSYCFLKIICSFS